MTWSSSCTRVHHALKPSHPSADVGDVSMRPTLMPGWLRGLGNLAVGLLAAAQIASLAYPSFRDRRTSADETSVARGRRLAASLGCFNCHGAGGEGGAANPTLPEEAQQVRFRALSEFDTVPAFTGRTQMMYVKSADDIREYIRDGAPRRKLADPAYRNQIAASAIRMPAFRDFVGAADVEDLVAFVRASSGLILPTDALAARGAEIAERVGCFSCHGPLGAGGMPNPGSRTGYVPGFWGGEFEELVQSDDELRGWLTDGFVRRVVDDPDHKNVLRRQALRMPEYGEFLAPDALDALVAYVRWLHDGAWRDGLTD